MLPWVIRSKTIGMHGAKIGVTMLTVCLGHCPVHAQACCSAAQVLQAGAAPDPAHLAGQAKVAYSSVSRHLCKFHSGLHGWSCQLSTDNQCPTRIAEITNTVIYLVSTRCFRCLCSKAFCTLYHSLD